MTDVKAAIIARMTGDIELMLLLVGGVYGVAEITPVKVGANTCYEVGRMLRSAVVRGEVSTAPGPRGRFSRQFVVIFFYDTAGYDTITEAMDRTRTLLHEQRIGNGAYEIQHVDTVDDQYDDALSAYMHRARFAATRRGF